LFYHDSESKGCFPEYTTLAADAGVNKRSVIRCINRLVNTGYLLKDRRFNKSNKYSFNWSAGGDRNDTSTPNPEVTDLHVEVTDLHLEVTKKTSGGDRLTPLTHEEPIKEPINNPSGGEESSLPEKTSDSLHDPNNAPSGNIIPANSHQRTNVLAVPVTFHQKDTVPAVSDHFEHFWAVYPKQEGKEDARRAFIDAVGSGVSAQTIITKAGGYARKVAAERTSYQYIALPVTWLRKKRWTDNYEAVVSSNPYAEEDAQYPPCPPGIRADSWRAIQRSYGGKLKLN
jgi:hypothetical protein